MVAWFSHCDAVCEKHDIGCTEHRPMLLWAQHAVARKHHGWLWCVHGEPTLARSQQKFWHWGNDVTVEITVQHWVPTAPCHKSCMPQRHRQGMQHWMTALQKRHWKWKDGCKACCRFGRFGEPFQFPACWSICHGLVSMQCDRRFSAALWLQICPFKPSIVPDRSLMAHHCHCPWAQSAMINDWSSIRDAAAGFLCILPILAAASAFPLSLSSLTGWTSTMSSMNTWASQQLTTCATHCTGT